MVLTLNNDDNFLVLENNLLSGIILNMRGYIYPLREVNESTTNPTNKLIPNSCLKLTGNITSANINLTPDNNTNWKPGCVSTIVLSKGSVTPTFTSTDAQYKIYYAEGYSDVTLSGSAKDKMVYCVMFDGNSFYINRQLYMS